MNSKRISLALSITVAILSVLLLFSVHEATTMLENKAKSLVNAKTNLQESSYQQTVLAEDKAEVAKYTALNQIAQSVVPQDKDQAEAVREIVNLASSSGIAQLSSITFPSSTLGTVTKGSSLTQVTPVSGISGVFDLPITISQANTSEIPYNDFINFLSALEQNRRTALVSSISIQPDQTNPNMISFTLVVDEFIKP